MADGSAITVSPTGKKSAVKDPDAVLDFPFDWSAWLTDVGDTYGSHSFVVADPAGVATPLVVASSSHVGGVVTAFVSGGTLDQTHALTCRLTTAGGRIDDRTLYIKVRAR